MDVQADSNSGAGRKTAKPERRPNEFDNRHDHTTVEKCLNHKSNRAQKLINTDDNKNSPFS